MAAGVGHGEFKGREGLFRRLHGHCQGLVVGRQRDTARIGIEHIGRVDGLGDIVCLSAGGDHAGLLVAGEHQIEIALGRPAFALQANEGLGEVGDAVLVIGRTAPEEEAVLLGHGEGGQLPILGQSVDHVHVAEQHDRFAPIGLGGGNADDEALHPFAIAVVVADHDVGVGEPRLLQSRHQIGDHLGRLGLSARGADGDDVAVDIEGLLLIRGQRRAFCRVGGAA